MTYTME